MQPDLEQFFAQAQAFEQQMRTAQVDLGRAIVTGRSADGSVTVLATGLGKLQRVQVDPVVFDQRDVQQLQTSIVEAMQAAADNAGQLAQQKMGPVEITLH